MTTLSNAGTSTPASPTLSPTRKPVQVVIEPGKLRQTLREVGGGNFIHYFGGVQQALDPVSSLNLETLKPQVVRVRIDLDLWEPLPGIESQARFQEAPYVKATFNFIAEIKKRNPQAIVVASIWEVPDWMVSNPQAENGRLIPVERYAQLIDSMVEWLLRARAFSDSDVDYVSFNEATIGINIRLTPAEQVALIRQSVPRFEQEGLSTRWLLGDTHNIASAPDYVPPIYEAEDIRPYLGPLSFHSWDSQVSDHLMRQIGKYADENQLEVWCTEGGWDPSQWNRSEEFPTFKHALRLANIYTRVLRDTRATTLLYWEMMGQDYAINDGVKPYPALVYLTELQKHFPAGAQIVATPDDEIQTLSILSLAARRPDDRFSVQLINQVNEERMVAISGLPDGIYTLTWLTEQGGRETGQSLEVKDGQAALVMPGLSIYFLVK